MTDYRKHYPTRGDLAREQVRRRGLLYFGNVQQEIRSRLTFLTPHARTAYALACAERLMRAYEQLPAFQRIDFTLSWRPLLELMWAGLAGQRPDALEQVQTALHAFSASPYNHDDGPEGLQEADEDAAAASMSAAQCYLSGEVQPADEAGSRAVEAAFRIADEDLQLDPNDFIWDPNAEPMPLAREAMHPAVQSELQLQLADLTLLERHEITSQLLDQLKHSNHP
jgi:hypothetical protein